MLFEIALIRKPTKTEAEDGKQEELILSPTPIIAEDEKSAALKAILEFKDKINGATDRLEVLVRRF